MQSRAAQQATVELVMVLTVGRVRSCGRRSGSRTKAQGARDEEGAGYCPVSGAWASEVSGEPLALHATWSKLKKHTISIPFRHSLSSSLGPPSRRPSPGASPLAATSASSHIPRSSGSRSMFRVPGRKPVRTSTSKSAAASEATFGAKPPAACDALPVGLSFPCSPAYEGGRERK